MKRILFILTTLMFMLPVSLPAHADKNPEVSAITSGSPVKVYYSFDHYANQPLMTRSFVSEDMLEAASHTGLLKSSAWDVSGVVSRLKSLLSLHTHSNSTTKNVRKDLEKVSALPAYERMMHTCSGRTELVVFCHRRGRGKDIDELLIFKFRDGYCSRVIQLTGKLRADDIAAILKMSKKK
ncbi:MAG: DUF4252 domain-containing protein [Paraprevotella sp.]|nr:DUF4252 domain-containing protein [Paraprevotella sp.]